MAMDFAAYKAAIETWVAAQSGLTVQWQDESGGWQGKPRIRARLHSSRPLGQDYLVWAEDTDLDDGEDFVPTVQGNRLLELKLYCRTRNQHDNNTAPYYLEKVRSSLKKPSTRATLLAADLVVASAEAVQDIEIVVDNRRESYAYLDVHLATVVNDRDESEADSWPESVVTTAELVAPDDSDMGWTDETLP